MNTPPQMQPLPPVHFPASSSFLHLTTSSYHSVYFVTELGLGRQIYFQGPLLTRLLVELIKKPDLVLAGALSPCLITPPEITACVGKLLEKWQFLVGWGCGGSRTPKGERPSPWSGEVSHPQPGCRSE